MDKIVRNVIIFAAVILVVAGGFTVFMISRNNSSDISNNPTAKIIAPADNSANSGEVQDVKLSVSGGTYILTPSVLKKGISVRMTADLTTVRGCSRDVVISAFNVRKYVKEGDNVITFTPTQTGTINIACSMNMYRGTFTVVDASTDSVSTTVQGLASPSTPVQDSAQAAISDNTNTAPTHTCGMTGSSGGGGCGGNCGASTGGCGCGG